MVILVIVLSLIICPAKFNYAGSLSRTSTPITGIADCCAPAASGHTAAPPSSAMNTRRFTA